MTDPATPTNPTPSDLAVKGHRQQALEALGDGGRTFHVARKLGWSTPKARYYLASLEGAGKVERHPRYTSENDIYWRPARHLQESHNDRD